SFQVCQAKWTLASMCYQNIRYLYFVLRPTRNDLHATLRADLYYLLIPKYTFNIICLASNTITIVFFYQLYFSVDRDKRKLNQLLSNLLFENRWDFFLGKTYKNSNINSRIQRAALVICFLGRSFLSAA